MTAPFAAWRRQQAQARPAAPADDAGLSRIEHTLAGGAEDRQKEIGEGAHHSPSRFTEEGAAQHRRA